MRAFSSAHCTDVRLITLRIKITTRRALALLNSPQEFQIITQVTHCIFSIHLTLVNSGPRREKTLSLGSGNN